MRIAVIDYRVVRTNPIGGCHLKMIGGLYREHQFTVFAPEFDNPDPSRIEWVRVACPKRPQALLFLAFHLLLPLHYWAYRLRRRARFDAVQVVESNVCFGDIAYVHFCHKAFLRKRWEGSNARGLRGLCRWLDHYLHALMEPVVYRRMRKIVVPSRGLARELQAEYPFTADKIHVVANPVDLERMRRPRTFDRTEFRRQLGLNDDDIALVFSALGHFERKGLPLLLGALGELKEPRVKMIVVGGRDDTVTDYRQRVADLGLQGQVTFVGMQQDVGPFLWAGDGFALPSHYETFSLVSFEAAAAELPVIVSTFHGLEDVIQDGLSGIIMEANSVSVLEALRRFLAMQPDQRRNMGKRAEAEVVRYDTSNFLAGWRRFFNDVYSMPPHEEVANAHSVI